MNGYNHTVKIIRYGTGNGTVRDTVRCGTGHGTVRCGMGHGTAIGKARRLWLLLGSIRAYCCCCSSGLKKEVKRCDDVVFGNL